MPSRDLIHSIKAVPGLPSTTVTNGNTATTQATGTDITGFESVTVLAYVSARTDGTYTFKVQDCDTLGGSYADLAAAQYIGGAVPAAQNAVGIVAIGVADCRQFIKVVCTQASGTSGATFAAPIVLGHPKHHGQAGGGTQVVV